MKQIILIVFQVVLGALLLTEQKLDKIYVGVLCVCTHTSLEANPESGFIWKPYNQ
jgi:hypothetical protein